MTVFLNIMYNLIQFCKGQSHIAVRAAVIQGDFPAPGIMDGGAGEAYVGHKASLLIPLLRCQQEILTAVEHFGRIVNVQNGSPDGIPALWSFVSQVHSLSAP